jgi:hypothetical protein
LLSLILNYNNYVGIGNNFASGSPASLSASAVIPPNYNDMIAFTLNLDSIAFAKLEMSVAE